MHDSGNRPFISFAFGAVVAAVALIAVSHGNVHKMAYGDGLIYRYVASHFTTPPAQIDPVVVVRGTSVRYGRVGFPALIWLFAAGRNGAMPYSQAVLMIIASGAACAAVSVLLPRAGPLGSMMPFIAPGFTMSLVGSYGEVPAVALALWAVVMLRRNIWLTIGLLAAAMLTREDAGVVLLGLAAWELWHRRPRRAALLWISVLPLVGWYAFVKGRYGHIPLFDPFLRVGTRIPGVAVYHSLVSGSTASMITAAIHVALAVLAFWMWRRSIFAAVAAAAALQVLSSGVYAWQYVGDAIRVFTVLQLFLLLHLMHKRWSEPEASSPENSSLITA